MSVARTLLAALLCPLALMACGDGGETASTTDLASTDRATTGAPSTTGAGPTTGATDASTSDDTTSDATSDATADAAEDAAADITIERSRFSMDEIRVPVGATVVWENLDGYAHTVTSTDDSPVVFDSSGLAEGERFEFTFDEPGTYPYFCQIHPTMRAVVIVE